MSCIVVCCPGGEGRLRSPPGRTTLFVEAVVCEELCFGSEPGCAFGNSTANDDAAGDVDRVARKMIVMKKAAATRARRKLSIVPSRPASTVQDTLAGWFLQLLSVC